MQFTTWITKVQKRKLYACKVFLQRFIGEKEKSLKVILRQSLSRDWDCTANLNTSTYA